MFSTLTFALFAAPMGGWKCGKAYGLTATIAYTDPGGITYCKKTWKEDCKHWLWGSKTITSTVTTVCNPYDDGTIDNDDYSDLDQYVDHHLEVCKFMADEMTIIQNSGISVPNNYLNFQLLYDDPAVFQACEKYRYELAGYDIDLSDPAINDDCFIPVITLPVQVPAAYPFEINESCITVSPNPTSTDITINLGDAHFYISGIELIENGTGLSVYDKSNSIQPVEQISVSGFRSGLYTLKLLNSSAIKTYQIQVLD